MIRIALQYDTKDTDRMGEGTSAYCKPEAAYSNEQSHRRSGGSALHDEVTRTR